MAQNNSAPKRVILWSQSRSRSHLIQQMLSAQPDTLISEHPFQYIIPPQAKLMSHGRYETTPVDMRTQLRDKWDECYRAMLKFCNDANSEGKTAFVHKHPRFVASPIVASKVYHDNDTTQLVDNDRFWTLTDGAGENAESRTSCTVLPDSFLETTTPLFLIRNPLHMVPSLLRVCIAVQDVIPLDDASMAFNVSYVYIRQLYDWYAAHQDTRPVVIDADDVVTNPEIVKEACRTIGMNANSVITEWAPASEKERKETPAFAAKIKETIMASSGLQTEPTAKGLTVESERPKWDKEFGVEQAAKVERWVLDAMGGYEYLFEKRLR